MHKLLNESNIKHKLNSVLSHSHKTTEPEQSVAWSTAQRKGEEQSIPITKQIKTSNLKCKQNQINPNKTFNIYKSARASKPNSTLTWLASS